MNVEDLKPNTIVRRRFPVDESDGKNQKSGSLAQSVSALYPSGTDECRPAGSVLAGRKGWGTTP